MTEEGETVGSPHDMKCILACITQPESRENLCIECCELQFTHFCLQCEIDLCEICDNKIHLLRAFATHQRVRSPLRPAPPVMCKIHENEILKLFCVELDCRKPVCVLCAFGDHRKHNCRVVEDVVTLEKGTLNNRVGDFRERVNPLKERMVELREAKNSLLSNHIVAVSRLKDDFNEARLILDSREAELQSELREHMMTRDAEITKLLNEMEELYNTSISAIKSVAEKCEKNGLEFLTVVDSENVALRTVIEDVCSVTEAFSAVPSSELEYKCNVGPYRNETACPIVNLLLQSLSAATLEYILEKPSLDEHLIVAGTVVLDPLMNSTGTAVIPLKYKSITLKAGGVLTVRGWQGSSLKGGVLALTVVGKLLIEEGGRIDVSGRGYNDPRGCDSSADSVLCSGRPGDLHNRIYCGGGGGGFATSGKSGTHGKIIPTNHNGGAAKGATELSDCEILSHRLLGYSGGKGIAANDTEGSECMVGGFGGGNLLIKAGTFCNYGEIRSDGGDGTAFPGPSYSGAGCGGGSDGSIKIVADDIERLGKISAIGGKGGLTGTQASGGDGGNGFIRVECSRIDLKSFDTDLVKPEPVIILPTI